MAEPASEERISGGGPLRWVARVVTLVHGVTIDGLALHMSSDPSAPYEKTDHALKIRNARNLRLADVELFWDEPASKRWQSA